MVSNRARPVAKELTLPEARELVRKLRKEGKDAFIMKQWTDPETGYHFEEPVR